MQAILGPVAVRGAAPVPIEPSSAEDGMPATGAPAPARARLLDDPAEWPEFGNCLAPATAGQGARWESHLVMQGMYCATCALTLEDALSALPGVESVQVNGASQRARVVWNAALTRPSAWLAAVQREGYGAVPATDMQARALRQREARRMLWRWGVAGLCMMQVMMYAVPAYTAGPGELAGDTAQLLRWASWVLSLPVVLFSCGPFFRGALSDLRQGRVGMDVPVALGMALAFAVSSAATFDPTGPLGAEVYFDSLTMFVFLLLTGRWFEQRLRERTAGALEALMHRLPDSVERQLPDGRFERVVARRLAAGDVIRVLPGEVFAADAVLAEGRTRVDEALISGESRPMAREAGQAVLAGSHNLQSPVLARVTHTGAATRFAQIVRLMEDASLQKPRLALAADRIARPFLWGVLLAAALAAAWHWSEGPGVALMAACVVLVVTCPCALSLATPAAMLSAAGALARRGVLVRRLQALETLASVDTVVFDKTGTLTEGGMGVAAIRTREGTSSAEALGLAAAVAAHSLHPVSRSIVLAHAASAAVSAWRADAVEEVAGQGLSARVRCLEGEERGRDVRLGSAVHCGIDGAAPDATASSVHLSDARGWLASFELTEQLRPDARLAVQALRAAGLQVRMLSGDQPAAARRVAGELGLDAAEGGCTPADKLDRLRDLQARGRVVAMVGDGLNDGPVLAGADASFAFGPAVPIAQARADVVVMGTELARVADTLLLARRTLRVVRQNLAWSVAYNATSIPLALAGYMPAWLAGLGMAASSLLVVLNAARLSRGIAQD
jgi:Cu2+-exporting ATPase